MTGITDSAGGRRYTPRMARHPCVYILASQRNGTLYIGVTGNIAMRIMLHKEGKGSAFTRKYKVDRLVWYEFHQDFGFAIEREKRLKNWHRQWKINLIERTKPGWEDLFETIQMWAPIG
ncbi:Excinuclease ABC, C subunit domain protein [Maricaulis maris MCS10]|uniref:Excinuclease ABC, C subunit domain protein n=2 Tax=Maricaulis maris TaxID=74318 RepID=Q0AN70_MARMM|nr:Excinuclease ABC, C subunit domain protein [Maricaulis maris MCS10]